MTIDVLQKITPTQDNVFMKGDAGTTYVPQLTQSGNDVVVSFTNADGLPNPTPATLKVPPITDQTLLGLFHKNIEDYYNLERTGKVYQTKLWKFATNPTSSGIKLLDNAGLVCEPSTDTVEGRDDYENIPMFKWVRCNYQRYDDGTPYPIAIEGDANFQTTGAVDVGAMQMSFYYNVQEFSDHYLYTVSDLPNEKYGLKPWVECVKADGTVVPWCVASTYASGLASDGKLRSQPNLKVADNQSHNNMITNYQKKGFGYWGAGACRNTFQILMFAIKYATKNTQDVMRGCSDYNFQYTASILRTTEETYFPITKAQANNLCVGSYVAVGYSNNGNTDRGHTSMRSYVRIAKITSIVEIDDLNSAVYMDITTGFTTADVSGQKVYISTMPFGSGCTDSVLAKHDGSYLSNLNGKWPYRIQGREYGVGAYTIPSDVALDFNVDFSKKVYFAEKGVAHSSSDATIRNTYKPIGTIPAFSETNSDGYIGDVTIDIDSGVSYPIAKGVSSSQGAGDYFYAGGATASGTRELLQCGPLWTGSNAGASFLDCWAWLGVAYWYCVAFD